MRKFILTVLLIFVNLYANVYAAEIEIILTDELSFEKALAAADTVEVPGGDYYLKSLIIPEGKILTGDEENMPVFHVCSDDNSHFIQLKSKAEISNIRIVNDAGKKQAINVYYAQDTRLSNLEISGFEFGVYNDHGNGMVCDGLKIRDTGNTAVNTIYASDIIVKNCIVENSKKHGIQFWNNWNGTRDGGRLLYENNTVLDVAGGGIWGSGAQNVTMRGNTVDNCGVVGLDLEYVKTADIYDNTVMRCANGGVACFMTCEDVRIYENRIYNNRPGYGVNDYMAGIWLTYENASYAYDTGNRLIDIYDNFIYCISDNGGHNYTREAVRICTRNYNEKKITVRNNTILGMQYRILFDTAAGSSYSYSANTSFDAGGTAYDIVSEDDETVQSLYKNVFTAKLSAGISSGGAYVIKDSSKRSGSTEVCVYFDKANTAAGAGVRLDVTDESSGKLLTSRTVTAAELQEGVARLYYDRSGSEDITYRAVLTSSYAKISRIEVGVAEFKPFVLIKTFDGAELLNNSFCSLKTDIIFRIKEDGAMRGVIKWSNESDNNKRQPVKASWPAF